MGLLALLLNVSLGATSAAPLAAPSAAALPALSSTLPASPDIAAGSSAPNVSGKYFGARYYASRIGRFTTTDPVYTWSENLVDPQRWNRYAYARNNPLRYVDPDGRAIDTIADVGFIGWDLFDMGRSAYRGEGISGTQWLALGGDIVGAAIPFATGVGAAIRAGNKIDNALEAGRAASNIIDNSKAIAKEGIYEFPDAVSAGKTYVGQSSNVPRRIGQHERSGKKAADAAASTTGVPGGKTAREAAEQRRINQLGGTRDAAGSQTSNVRNPIGEGRRADVEKKFGPLDR